jgi:hypothetical protein
MNSIENLIFHIQAVKAMKASDLDFHSVTLAELDRDFAADQARKRILGYALKELDNLQSPARPHHQDLVRDGRIPRRQILVPSQNRSQSESEEIYRMFEACHRSPYNLRAKAAFRRLSTGFLREVARLSGAPDTDVRFNAGGIAVSGEATLHTDKIYIQVSNNPLGILVRTCESRTDYTGGPNHWIDRERLLQHGAEGLAKYATQLVGKEVQP